MNSVLARMEEVVDFAKLEREIRADVILVAAAVTTAAAVLPRLHGPIRPKSGAGQQQPGRHARGEFLMFTKIILLVLLLLFFLGSCFSL